MVTLCVILLLLNSSSRLDCIEMGKTNFVEQSCTKLICYREEYTAKTQLYWFRELRDVAQVQQYFGKHRARKRQLHEFHDSSKEYMVQW